LVNEWNFKNTKQGKNVKEREEASSEVQRQQAVLVV
jgi:hypothetical protein